MASNVNLSKMDNVFKSHPQPHVLKDLLAQRRKMATDIIHNCIPAKILHFQALIAEENNPESIWYHETSSQPSYTDIKMIQPTRELQTSLKNESNEGKNITLPDDLIGNDKGVEEGVDSQGGNQNKGSQSDHWFEVLDTNKTIMECMEIIGREAEEMYFTAQDLTIWLNLEIPLIEDGNSFGAEVQKHLIDQLTETYKYANYIRDQLRLYHLKRSDVAKEWAQCPNLQDRKAAIMISDKNQHITLRGYLRRLLMLQATLLNKFERNWVKVINPKGSSSREDMAGMY
ncbi:uncharacterized protein L203_105143 [Cryptococcus depauperatus CBS 7841]|uniref:Uncharacterized protein n=1 Tax=Cryptococcus depauperatus CBS 7841 TaxID=1295531 RepID=A0A1E3HVA1_9TREE|nr:hypothetical protein L203_05842 [Cryptococcus depauperatus CBS 7841]